MLTDEEQLKAVPERERGRYRAFADAFGAALRQFDRANEWADLLKHLGRLQKILERHPQFAAVPEPLLLTRRLAQCLNPVLPGGLHAKALEVLDAALERLGPAGVARSLPLALGAFPLFRAAPIAVRAQLLRLFERRLLPLGARLAPCVGSLVLALLPGVEEPNGESYAKVRDILDALAADVGEGPFFSALWMCLLRSPHVRLPALHVIRLRLSASSSSAGCLPERDSLVLQALVQALQDQKLLVLRETMELVAAHFRLRSEPFPPPQLRALVGAALSIVTRKETGLSRRLFSWLLGTEDSGGVAVAASAAASSAAVQQQLSGEEYFERYAKVPVIGAVRDMFAASMALATGSAAAATAPAAVALRPIRVLEALIDRDEIGSQIVDEIIGDSLAMLVAFKSNGVVMREVQQFLDSLAMERLWSHIIKFSRDALHNSESLQLLSSVLDALAPPSSAEEVAELVSTHLPRLLEAVSATLLEMALSDADVDLTRALHLALKVVGKIPQEAVVDSRSPESPEAEAVASTSTSFPAPDSEMISRCMANFGKLFCRIAASDCSEVSDTGVLTFDLTVQLLGEAFLRFSTRLERSANSEWFGKLCARCCANNSVIATLSIRTLLSLVERSPDRESIAELAPGGMPQLFREIAVCLWEMLQHSKSGVHYEAVGFLLALERLDPDAVHTVFVSRMTKAASISERCDAYQRFSLLWRLSGEVKAASEPPRPFTRGLFLMLDTLLSDHPEIRLTGQSWLAESSDKADRILDPLLLEALDQATLRRDGVVYNELYDTRRVLYIIRMLRILFNVDSGVFADRALQRLVSRDVLALNEMHTTASPDFLFIKVARYVDLITVMCLRFIQGTLPDGADSESVASNAVVQTTAAELLQRMLARIGGASTLEGVRIASLLQAPILADMAQAVSSSNLVLQVHLLSLLRTMVAVDFEADSKRLRQRQSMSADQTQSPSTTPVVESPMFLQTLIIGILQPVHKNLRCYWLDFLTSVLSVMGPNNPTRSSLLKPILDALCGIIESVPAASVFDSLPSNDVAMLIRTILFVLSQDASLPPQQQSAGAAASSTASPTTLAAPSSAPSSVSTEQQQQQIGGEHTTTSEAGTSPSSVPASSSTPAPSDGAAMMMAAATNFVTFPVNLVGLLKDAFTSTVQKPTEQHLPIGIEKLPAILHALLHVYGAPIDAQGSGSFPSGSGASSAPTSKLHNKYALQDLVFRVMDLVMQRFPVELLRALVRAWPDDAPRQRLSLEILNTMEAASEDTVLGACSAIIIANRRKQQQQQQHQPQLLEEDRSVLSFMSAYIEQSVSPDGLSKAWPHFNTALKLLLASRLWSGETSTLFLRTLHAYFTRVCAKGKKPSVSDRRERQELAQRFVEAILLMISQQQGTVPPPAPEPESEQLGGSSSSLPSFDAAAASTSAAAAGSPSTPTIPSVFGPLPELNLEMVRVLGPLLLPVLDLLYEDKEKLVPVLGSLFHALIPLTRARWTPHAEAVVQLIGSSCAYPYAMRAWRKDVWDAFHELDFFSPATETAPSSLLALWEAPIDHLMSNDKLAFGDLLKNVLRSLQLQQSIFTKEHEGLNRGKHLRRLSFVLFCGANDQYVRSLPAIKERVVEAFRNSEMPLLMCQAFLCLRVMFVRFSPPHLASFLPVVLTELMSVLSRPVGHHQKPLNAEVLLAACKLIDTLLLLPDSSSSLSINNWIFVSEQRVHPRAGLYQPLLEHLAESIPPAEAEAEVPTPVLGKPLVTARSLFEPEARQQLWALLRRYSDITWDAQVAAVQPDIAAISQLVLSDFTFLPAIQGVSQQPPEIPHAISYH